MGAWFRGAAADHIHIIWAYITIKKACMVVGVISNRIMELSTWEFGAPYAAAKSLSGQGVFSKGRPVFSCFGFVEILRVLCIYALRG